MNSTHMTCKQLIEFICDYLEGELPSDQRRSFEKHLDRCPCCKNYLDSYRKTIAAGKKACCCEESAPPQMPPELVQAILAARNEQNPSETDPDCSC